MSRIASPAAAANESVAPSAVPARRVFIKSFGCQMNVYDSQRMADVAGHEGYSETAAIEEADLVVLNTCHIRERASEKIYSELGKIRELKQERAASGRKTTLVVAGCVAQAEGREILRRQPAVDLVVGPQNYHRLPELLAALGQGVGVVDTEFPAEDKFDHLPAASPESVRSRGVSAYRHRARRLRQILLVLRGALYARRRKLAPGRQDHRRDRATGAGRRARIHAARPERQRLSRAGRARRRRRSSRSHRAGGAHSRRLAAALRDLASQRHARGPHTRPCRDRSACALSASADSIGFGSDPGGDEPTAYEARISRDDIPGSARAARHSVVLRLHRRLPRRERRRFRSDAGPRTRGRIRLGFRLQIFTATRHARGRIGRTDRARGQDRTACAAPGSTRSLNARLSITPASVDASRSSSTSPAGTRVNSSGARPICSRSMPSWTPRAWASWSRSR